MLQLLPVSCIHVSWTQSFLLSYNTRNSQGLVFPQALHFNLMYATVQHVCWCRPCNNTFLHKYQEKQNKRFFPFSFSCLWSLLCIILSTINNLVTYLQYTQKSFNILEAANIKLKLQLNVVLFPSSSFSPCINVGTSIGEKIFILLRVTL